MARNQQSSFSNKGHFQERPFSLLLFLFAYALIYNTEKLLTQRSDLTFKGD